MTGAGMQQSSVYATTFMAVVTLLLVRVIFGVFSSMTPRRATISVRSRCLAQPPAPTVTRSMARDLARRLKKKQEDNSAKCFRRWRRLQ